MENLMPKVAELLCVEIGEEFNVKNIRYSFKFTPEDLYNCSGNVKLYTNNILIGLLMGEYEIIKKPWIPKNGDTFYYINFDGQICAYQYTGHIIDETMFKIGNCFKTEEEITPDMIDKFVKFYADDTQVFNVLEEN